MTSGIFWNQCVNLTFCPTGRLGQYVDKWVNVYGLQGGEVAKMMQEDQIDILVELTGHTANNRYLCQPIACTAVFFAGVCMHSPHVVT